MVMGTSCGGSAEPKFLWLGMLNIAQQHKQFGEARQVFRCKNYPLISNTYEE